MPDEGSRAEGDNLSGSTVSDSQRRVAEGYQQARKVVVHQAGGLPRLQINLVAAYRLAVERVRDRGMERSLEHPVSHYSRRFSMFGANHMHQSLAVIAYAMDQWLPAMGTAAAQP
jgi:hypothetical protein